MFTQYRSPIHAAYGAVTDMTFNSQLKQIAQQVAPIVNLPNVDQSTGEWRKNGVCCVSPESTDLSHAVLNFARLEAGFFTNANLVSANRSTASLGHADLSGANLTGAYLTGAYLAGAGLVSANFSGVDLAGASFDPDRLRF